MSASLGSGSTPRIGAGADSIPAARWVVRGSGDGVGGLDEAGTRERPDGPSQREAARARPRPPSVGLEDEADKNANEAQEDAAGEAERNPQRRFGLLVRASNCLYDRTIGMQSGFRSGPRVGPSSSRHLTLRCRACVPAKQPDRTVDPQREPDQPQDDGNVVGTHAHRLEDDQASETRGRESRARVTPG